MAVASRGFQVFVKPAGAACNLACRYCYYLDKGPARPGAAPSRMPEDLLESTIAQHIAASPDDIIRFSWHGGEPTILGVGYFRKIVEIERRHGPPGRTIANGLQTNGTLLDEEWGRFLAAEGFSVGLSLDGPRRAPRPLIAGRGTGRSSFDETMRGYEVLRRHGVPTDILCVVSAANVRCAAEVYGFFKGIGASYVTFLPLVERRPDGPDGVSADTVPAEAWGDFLCAVFDEWVGRGHRAHQGPDRRGGGPDGLRPGTFALHLPAGLRRHPGRRAQRGLLLLRSLRGPGPPPRATSAQSPLARRSSKARPNGPSAGPSATPCPRVCRECEVLDMCNGECPKNRFARAPDGEPGLNYLCVGYKNFFTRVRAFVDAVAAEWRRQNPRP